MKWTGTSLVWPIRPDIHHPGNGVSAITAGLRGFHEVNGNELEHEAHHGVKSAKFLHEPSCQTALLMHVHYLAASPRPINIATGETGFG
jgi:hypothetical protein